MQDNFLLIRCPQLYLDVRLYYRNLITQTHVTYAAFTHAGSSILESAPPFDSTYSNSLSLTRGPKRAPSPSERFEIEPLRLIKDPKAITIIYLQPLLAKPHPDNYPRLLIFMRNAKLLIYKDVFYTILQRFLDYGRNHVCRNTRDSKHKKKSRSWLTVHLALRSTNSRLNSLSA